MLNSGSNGWRAASDKNVVQRDAGTQITEIQHPKSFYGLWTDRDGVGRRDILSHTLNNTSWNSG